jgi:carbon-monoxide dehydrogenase large subunit
MARTRIGDRVTRTEDRRFVTGRGRYVDDIAMAGMARVVVVRSPLAHADIRSIDMAAAAAAPGVLAVLTGADYAADGLGDIPCISLSDDYAGPDWCRTPFPALAAERVRCVGDAVAVVVAESLEQARDAAELVEVDYDPLPAVVSVATAMAADAPQIWPGTERNICFEAAFGDADKTAAAFAAAAHVTEIDLTNGRVAANSMEPRGSIGTYDAGEERYTLTTSTQNPHWVRNILAQFVFAVPDNRIRVKAGDVGGGFGMKGMPYPEDILVLWAARRIGRPVKWIGDRGESLLSDFPGRDHACTGRLALDADGKILAIDAVTNLNLGCRLSPEGAIPAILFGRMATGVYDVPAAHVRMRGVFTNTQSTTPYRGAGRPEAIYLVERLLDKAARETGLDPISIRRRNYIGAAQMPYQTAIVDRFDSGEFEAALDEGLELGDWDGYDARREESAARGLLRGRGMSSYIEVASLFNDRMEIRFDPSGNATVVAGTFSHGQGHETAFPQMVSDWLGLPIENIAFLQGDTDRVSHGGGTFGSRSITVGGSALRSAADDIIAKGRRIAAHMLETAAEDIDFEDGLYTVRGTNRSLSLTEAAAATYAPVGLPAELGVGLEAVGYFAADKQNYPNGCHVVEVEIDPETGEIRVDRFVAVDDVGTVINPLLADGQIHGGIAQGVGQALTERVVYDDDGQLLSGSFMDYTMPRADDVPNFRTAFRPVPTANNPLGVKGAGETGSVGAPPAIVQAIVDALAPLGVHDIEMPATPSRIWQAIREASRGD